jgi:hypothetical protein
VCRDDLLVGFALWSVCEEIVLVYAGEKVMLGRVETYLVPVSAACVEVGGAVGVLLSDSWCGLCRLRSASGC